MIRLNLKREPYWLELFPGLRLKVRPGTSAIIMSARSVMRTLQEEDAGIREAALIKTVAASATIDWEGPVDLEDKPTPFSPEGLAALMDHYEPANAFNEKYIKPALVLEETLEAEKNA